MRSASQIDRHTRHSQKNPSAVELFDPVEPSNGEARGVVISPIGQQLSCISICREQLTCSNLRF